MKKLLLLAAFVSFAGCSQNGPGHGSPVAEITNIHGKSDPYDLKPGIFYRIKIPNDHTMYFKYREGTPACSTVFISNFDNAGFVLFGYYGNDKTFSRCEGSERIGMVFFPFLSRIESDCGCSHPAGNIYRYFSVKKRVRSTTPYGYDIFIQEN